VDAGIRTRHRRTEFYDSTQTWRKHLTDAEGDRVLEFMRQTDRVAA
jgi:hypothetical protein